MNYEDEHYVRIYTRDTKTVKRWGWEGRVLFRELMTKVDKAGVLDGIDEPVEDIALMVELPEDLVRTGLPRLLKSGSVSIHGTNLVIPNYIEGQTARKSDKLRAQESRTRRSDAARLGELVTICDAGVTKRTNCDETEHDVTACDKGHAVTNRDAPVTECDNDSPNRDETSEVVRSCHSTQCNADQRNATTLPSGGGVELPRNRSKAIALSLPERFAALNENQHLWDFVESETWPETVEVAGLLADGLGIPRPKLQARSRDSSTKAILALLEAFSLDDLRRAASTIKENKFFSGKRSLTVFSLEVMRIHLNSIGAPKESQETPWTN